MRTTTRALGTTIATALGSLLLTIPATAPAHAATGVQLPITYLGDMAVDGTHHKVFVSDPVDQSGRIAVADYEGNTTWLNGPYGAAELVLSPDDQTLYVAARHLDSIIAYDTTTLAETGRYYLGADTSPWGLALAGGKLWFSYGDFTGDLGSLDLSAPEPVVTLGLDESLDPTAQLATSPTDPDVLVAGTNQPNRNTLTVYDVGGGTPTTTARRTLAPAEMNGLRDLDVSPDGRTVVTAALISTGYQAFRLDDLTDATTHTTPSASPLAVAVGPDGTVAGAAQNSSADIPDVSFYAPGATTPLTTLELGSATQSPEPGGLAWAPDGSRVFTVTREPGVIGLYLHSSTVTTTVESTLTLSAPATSRKGRALTVTGTLTAPGLAPGATVEVTRYDATSSVPLGTITVPADGTFTVTDAPAKAGTVRYGVTYAGDHWHTPASAEMTVEITRH
ncbi:hypothetical protein SRB5_14900 [Streptomyces sp. RB5]|uniref:Ig-like domain repeat protein n=1 Tax=Streptomyces smaragdinus TaxID=2585196 RepID=A0A7K0CF33_9ACTN|nr:hypothetical protein [Streptomyces smaragdinus]MQY11374.1 hypothetical protein [Streptomyces smaragdinus]